MHFLNKKVKYDIIYRKFFWKLEIFKLFLIALSKNFYIHKQFRFYILNLKQALIKYSSISFIKNRCLITGNSRSVFRKFKLSRWELKKMGLHGELPGLKKGSW